TTWPRAWVAGPLTLTTVDAQAAINVPGRRIVLRAWWPTEHRWPHVDGQATYVLTSSRHLAIRLSLIGMVDSEDYDDTANHHVALHREPVRMTLEELYRRGAWTDLFAQSIETDSEKREVGTVQHHDDSRFSFGSRNEL